MGKIIDQLKTLLFFKLMTIYLRFMIGFAFVFASFVKIAGNRFTSIPPSHPVGYFFEAMYSTGMYWKFLGWGQLIAGALLMTQRFSTIGALLFLPIIANVFMITHSIDFGMGTPVITTLMLLGTIYLVVWDYKKWIILFQKDHHIKLDLTTIKEDKFMNDPVWTVTGIVFLILAAYPWLFDWKNFPVWVVCMLLVGIAGFVVMMFKWRSYKKATITC